MQIHSRAERRYRCTVCGRTFGYRKGTPFYRCRVPPATILQVLTLLAYGCPVAAIVAAFGFQARTVRRWLVAAGQHCQGVHQEQVAQPRALGQVQADELRAKLQGSIHWVAMAVAVPSRLWLGGVLSAQRNTPLMRRLVAQIRACVAPGPLLVCVDGWHAYVDALRKAFRTVVPRGAGRRPQLVPWPQVVVGQVIKHYEQRRLVEVVRRLRQGSEALATQLLAATQGRGVLNTAYIERLNATFRARLAALCRRTRSLARQPERLQATLYWIGTVYNFCTHHASLRGPDGRGRTPAMAAGITDHCWSLAELLWHRVPPPRWQPPKRRGPKSRALQQLIQEWCT